MDNTYQKKIDAIFEAENSSKEVVEALEEIQAIQKGSHFMRTGVDHLDYFLIDGLMGKFVFIGARPAQGKTHLGSRIVKNILDPDINKGEYSVLRFNWEMATKSLLLRSFKEKLKKSMRTILDAPFTADEQVGVDEVLEEYTHPNIRNISEIYEGDALRYMLDKFCQSVPPTTKKIIVIDHIHILPNKERIDSFLTILNEYKMRYPNLGFIIFFQLNRVLESVWRGGKDSKANPKNFRPNSSHIYNTDMLFQLADIIMTLVIPQVVNLDKYAAINKEYHPNLDDHFLDEGGDSNWVRLEGRNRIFYDYIKIRMADDFEDPRLYVDILNLDREAKLHVEGTDKEILADVPAFMKKDTETAEQEVTNPVVNPDVILGDAEAEDDIPF